MKARVNRFYWEELEEIIDNLTDKVSEIESAEVITPFLEDKKVALLALIRELDYIVGIGE